MKSKKNKLKKSQKKRLWSIIVGTVLFVLGEVFSIIGDHVDIKAFSIVSSVLFILAGVAAGYTCVIKAFQGIKRGEFFDENTLMTIAVCGAIAIGEYPECAAVMVLYQIGELFQSIAVGRSRNAIKELTKLCPDIAHRVDGENESDVSPEELSVGDIVRIRPGERVPVDCIITKGTSSIDTSPVTGESVPRDASTGTEIYSGCINQNALIEAKVSKPATESAAGRILKLTETASDRKTKSEAFITKFAKVYTPCVTIFAALVAFLVPLALLIFAHHSYLAELRIWGYRALSMLVISCPCALVISIPLGYFCGLGNASKNAIMIKGSTFIDTLANAKIAVFDKTGTLTEGKLSVSKIDANGIDEDEMLALCATAESVSSHPIAKAICAKSTIRYEVESVSEISGKGVSAVLKDGRKVEVVKPSVSFDNTAVEVFIDGESRGFIHLADSIKPTTKEALKKLRKYGIEKTVMLTGDMDKTAQNVGREVGVDVVLSELLPEDKFENIEKLCNEGTVMYVGDGINDSPSLARADVGIAMGVLGSEAAVEAADVVLMTNDMNMLAYSVKLAHRTKSVVTANIIFSLGLKILVLILTMLGVVGMWAAVLADVGVCILAVSNSMRLLKNKRD